MRRPKVSQNTKENEVQSGRVDTQLSGLKPPPPLQEPEEAAKSETESAASQPVAVKAEDPSEAEDAPKAEEASDAPKAPEQAVVLAKGRSCENKEKWRSACISLDGLLDYDEEDRDEGTLEMNIFAENFTEMLSQSYGQLILDALYAERCSPSPACQQP